MNSYQTHALYKCLSKEHFPIIHISECPENCPLFKSDLFCNNHDIKGRVTAWDPDTLKIKIVDPEQNPETAGLFTIVPYSLAIAYDCEFCCECEAECACGTGCSC